MCRYVHKYPARLFRCPARDSNDVVHPAVGARDGTGSLPSPSGEDPAGICTGARPGPARPAGGLQQHVVDMSPRR